MIRDVQKNFTRIKKENVLMKEAIKIFLDLLERIESSEMCSNELKSELTLGFPKELILELRKIL